MQLLLHSSFLYLFEMLKESSSSLVLYRLQYVCIIGLRIVKDEDHRVKAWCLSVSIRKDSVRSADNLVHQCIRVLPADRSRALLYPPTCHSLTLIIQYLGTVPKMILYMLLYWNHLLCIAAWYSTEVPFTLTLGSMALTIFRCFAQ